MNSIIFIHIPKTAGFAIGRCLRDIGALKHGYGFSHVIARRIVKQCDSKCVIMGVVRNPYDRLYSIYEFYRKKRTDIKKNVTFENFIMNYKNYEKYEWADTCYNYLTNKDGKLMTTDIIKFENLQTEYNMFCKKYNIENNLIERNKNDLKDNNVRWDKLYTEEMQKEVNRIFKNDFETFNYSYSGFLKSKDLIEQKASIY